MIVLICGGRDYSDRELLFRSLDDLHGRRAISRVVHGAARGADRLAGEWADARGIPVDEYPAEWRKHGQSAGPIRNREMLTRANPDLVVAFPGGRGTADMVGVAERSGVEVWKPIANLKEEENR